MRLDRTTIRAPVAGVVSRRGARLGAVVGMAGEPLFRLIAGGAVELEAGVPETRLAQIRPGQPATIAAFPRRPACPPMCGWSRRRSARRPGWGASRIAPDGDGAPGAIGSFARATVEVAREAGVIVPLSAVLFEPGWQPRPGRGERGRADPRGHARAAQWRGSAAHGRGYSRVRR